MKREKKEIQLDAGFDYDGFDYKGIHYPPHSVKDVLTLKRVESPYYETEDGVDSWMEATLDYCFVSSQSDQVINKVKQSPEEWRNAVDNDYAKNFSVADIIALAKLVVIARNHEHNANVEVLEDGEGK